MGIGWDGGGFGMYDILLYCGLEVLVRIVLEFEEFHCMMVNLLRRDFVVPLVCYKIADGHSRSLNC